MSVRKDFSGRWLAAALLLGLVGCSGSAESMEGDSVDSGEVESVQADGIERVIGASAGTELASPIPSAPRPSSPPPAPVSPSASRVLAVPAGTVIPAAMEVALSTRTHKAGDIFHARVTEDILAADGMVLVPQGARLEGRVAEARQSSSSDEEALLLLTFENLLIQGERFPLDAVVTEAQVQSEARDSGARSAATVATGAAAGAVVGRILGRDTRSTVQGAVVGAVAGAGVALTTRDGHASIEEGARVAVRLDSPTILADR